MYKLLGFGSIAFVAAYLLTVHLLKKNSEKMNLDQDKVITRDITVSTRDGLDISVKSFIPQGYDKLPAVLLLHMLGKDKSSWNKLIPILTDGGFAVYNADVRGHGRSVKMQNGREIFYQSMNENDWKKIPDDINDLISFISQDKLIDSSKISIIGASIGANAAIITASEHQDKIKTIVALSPGLNYRGLETLDYAENLTVPVLLATASEDSYSYESCNRLNEVVKTDHDLLIYNNSEHGTNLLNQTEELQQKIISWLDEFLKK